MSSSLDTAVSLPPDVSRGYQYVAVQWTLVSISIIVVLLRICFRGMIRRKIGSDDFAILAALSILAIFQVNVGFGRNIQYLRPTQIQDIGRGIFITILFNIIGTSFVRISVCLFILQLLPITQRISRLWIYGFMVFFTIIAMAAFLSMCFQCIPVQGIWNKSINAHCTPSAVTTKVNQASGAFSIITDIVCVLLPIMVFRRLQISWEKKVALFIVLGLGLLTAGAAVARTVLYNFGSTNPTWDIVPDAIWACVEQNIGIIVASMPALRQLLVIFEKPPKAQRSRSSRRPFAGANQFITSPLYPSTNDMGSDQIPSPDPSVSTYAEKMDSQQEIEIKNESSPPIGVTSRPAGTGISGGELHGVKDHQDAKAKECNKAWEERRESRPTLGNLAVLGYSCEAEGGTPKLAAQGTR